MKNKLLSIIILYLSILLFGCNPIEKRIIKSSSYEVEGFNLIQRNKLNQLSFVIDSPKAVYDEPNKILNIKNSTITIYSEGSSYIRIKSDLSILDRNKNLLTSKGNIVIEFPSDNKDININGQTLEWNLAKDIIILGGVVNVNSNSINLISKEAIYDKQSKKLFFERLINYNLLDPEKKKKIVTIKADKAILDNIESELKFFSNNKQVNSIINIDNLR